MLRILPLFLAALILVASGVVHGWLGGLWGLSNEPAASAQKLEAVPKVIGDWIGTDHKPLTAQEIAIGHIAGSLSRTYQNRVTGVAISVLLLCGKPGPIGVHTPDVCFVGAGMELLAKPERTPPEQVNLPKPALFFAARFRGMAGDVPTVSRAFWTWSSSGKSGEWLAPDSPRLAFAGKPALYKLYLTRQLVSEDETLEADPSLEFAKLLMPELEKALYSAPDATNQDAGQ